MNVIVIEGLEVKENWVHVDEILATISFHIVKFKSHSFKFCTIEKKGL